MNPRHAKRILLFVLAAVLIGVTARQGFGNAWVSQYTFASAPAKKDAAPKPAAPPVAQEPDNVMQPKPVALSKRVTEYHIDVTLQENAHMLQGEQSVTWTNPGKQQVSELYFHFYPNAFRSKDTTFMKESGGQLREDKATSDSTGYMNLLSLETTEGYSLLPRLHFVQPDDGNPSDLTLAKLKLPTPVAPGKSVTLRMKFEVKLPEVFARMGYSGNFVMAGQWFPKLAVYETAGTRGRATEGWNVHQYHGNSEFYSDFGIYSVKINVPSSYKVAATGFQTKASVVKDGRKTYQFYADDVIDFGWSASPDFIYYEEPYSTTGVPGVRIKLYLDPLHAKFKDRYLHAAKSALAKYAQWYGEYPYTTLSVVVPPKGGNGAGGMEYPTLVTAFSAENSNPGYDLERTVVHEIGHQYWYGMVASNEFEEAWLDEGFTSYAEDKVMESEYGVAPNLPVESSYMTDPAPLKQLSWSYQSNNHYAENVYIRAKLVLVGIERQVGDATMRKIMRTYFQKYKFKHPSTADFQKVVETVTKTKWNDYFSHFVYGDAMSDYSVDSIRVKPVKQDGQQEYENVVLIKKTGGSIGPVTVMLHFADGTVMPRVWDGQDAHVQIKIVHSSKLLWAAVDPQNDNVLDNKHINNFMKADLDEKTRTRWSVGLSKLVETLFSSLAW
ncbi:M1 family metallopeptidase [Paenibacillus rhizovicinus]|uniref:M1 family metallopeptidase n=1 Tax=Paenibacillus rhizovicinus TaxID=2704463 RepID=A0A6C0P0M0_9BACL|nr:M1 family metallopeptidase [Paenibacillus rhizovicinus]QHW32007.1 M1 family metallopeptidase [Paenibacillus rhizovicinus]